ncbi:MAG: alpha/beta fold hydrolase [Gaiellaceae bacterium]
MRRLVAVAAIALAAAPAAGAKLPLHSCYHGGASGLCGKLVVPENRAKPGGRTIALQVMVLKAMGTAHRADPIFHLVGGPGGAATESASIWPTAFADLNWNRDVVLVDQRGTGGSNPLSCPEPGNLTTKAQAARFVHACLAGLKGDPLQYGTATAADDLEAVRKALGYGKIDLYGGSYGATVAQVFLNRHPDSVRAVVLDGGSLIDLPMLERFGSNGERALDLVARRCAAEKQCAKAFPTWRADLPKLTARLDAKPAKVDVAGEKVTLTGASVAGVLQSLTMSADGAAGIPFVVAQAVRGNYAPLARVSASAGASAPPKTLLEPYSVFCSEPWARRSIARVRADAAGTYLARTAVAWAQEQATLCDLLPKRAERPQDWARPHGTTPLLAVLGEADPQDPLRNIEGIRQTMPNARIVVVPGQGHTVGHLGCMPAMIARFLERGSAAGLDVSCARRIATPSFRLS